MDIDKQISSQPPRNGGSMCDDILFQIVARLPFKSLHRFKLASKQWLALITHQLSPKFLGFYFHLSRYSRCILANRRSPYPIFRSVTGGGDGGAATDTSINTSLSFLPCHDYCDSRDIWIGGATAGTSINTSLSFLPFLPRDSRDIWILDRCNGLTRLITGGRDGVATTNISINTSPSFLPSRDCHSRDIWIIDHCNGLVLVLVVCFEANREVLYVCNPATKSWDSVPLPFADSVVLVPYNFYNIRLAFDPSISGHYKLVSLVGRMKVGHSSCLEISTYSSEEVGVWQVKRLFDLESCYRILNVECSAFCNGALFVAFSSLISGRILRVDLLSEGHRLIDFPELARGPVHQAKGAIGKMGDELCYGELYGRELRIWALGGEAQDSWVLKHEKTVNVLEEGFYCKNQILAFHPFIEAVYILMHGRVFAYDLNSMSLEEACTLETDDDDEYLPVFEATIFPFVPCSRVLGTTLGF